MNLNAIVRHCGGVRVEGRTNSKLDCEVFPQATWFKYPPGCRASIGEAEEDPGGTGSSDLWWKPIRHLCGESG